MRAVVASLGTVVVAVTVSSWLWGRSRRRQRGEGIVDGYVGLIGKTPMVRLASLSAATGCEILAKVEYLNPGGTGKDRIALSMIREAEASGKLKPGGTVVEGTSGSTGIALAALCRAMGYKCVIVMPDDQADEKVQLLRQFGAEVRQVKTAAISNPGHYVKLAEKYARDTPEAVFMDQFENDANFKTHYQNTAQEIWQQTNGGRFDAFVMGAGTGGTIAGVSRFLRDKGSKTRVFLVDPPGSSLANKVNYGVCFAPQQAERSLRRHRYDTIAEGIGLDRVTHNFAQAFVSGEEADGVASNNATSGLGLGSAGGSGSSSTTTTTSSSSSIYAAITVTDQAAVDMAHYLLRHEGIFVGCSSAMNCVGAVEAARQLGPGHTVVTVLCDSGQRYLSRFWSQEFIEKWGLVWPSTAPPSLSSSPPVASSVPSASSSPSSMCSSSAQPS